MPIYVDRHPKSERDGRGSDIDFKSLAYELMATQTFISLASLARALGISYRTVYAWWRDDTEFASAFRTARQNAVDEVKEAAVVRATGADGAKSSDLMMIYILNNFDQEIVERTSKQQGAQITIRLEVPSNSLAPNLWASEVTKALPDAAIEAKYKEIINADS